ncbi:DUF2268 domain-containing protein [Bacillus sp. FJAT-27445]|uniref:DUF2268 domain-containing protein n=1 Tax=Bacillus sp. FJAT-27445 TaxID=1679166 RepID=UPI000743C9A4|nr:DUF2268 domain-containing putative Zn-dependent protease [Bacillus sp. FJAT-27445]
MAIVPTDEWLKENWHRPEMICKQLEPFFQNGKPQAIYDELLSFGMYRPSSMSGKEIEMLLESGAWEKTEQLFKKYQAKWKGPEVPVFIFPAAKKKAFFRKAAAQKSGVSYPDKLFLFLPIIEDPKELEALLVHEYHHVCRINTIEKEVRENTLLESMIMEGLAEYAVYHECGEEYLAEWCSLYEERELMHFFKVLLQDNLDKKRTDKVHDRLLFGGNGIPRLLGYCYGYYLVKKHFFSHDFSLKDSFEIKESSFFL